MGGHKAFANGLARRVLHRATGDERGAMAITIALSFSFVFMFFALAFDMGLWLLDRRLSQNQADAVVLAAVLELPSTDTTAATTAADTWLTRNNSVLADRTCLEYTDRSGDGAYDTAHPCILRDTPTFFAALSGIAPLSIGAEATASVARATGGNVMPWAVVPPDPTCDNPSEQCQADLNGDGTEENCGYYPPVPAGEDLCPWGLSVDKLYVFKEASPTTPGNFGAIQACGNGATNYVDCINGEEVSGFYKEGETVNVGPQTGNLGANTSSALADRYVAEGSDGTWECDVASTPTLDTGMDPDGRVAANTKYVDSAGCEHRLVSIAIIDHFPNGGSEDLLVLGVATFALAGWDRNAPYGNSTGNTTQACGSAPGSARPCGMVWGYLMQDARPPDFLLEQDGDSDNPFAPLLVTLIN